MFFRQILHLERSCLSYVIGCPTESVAMVIDPQGDPQQYIATAKLRNQRITHIVETHTHADHVSCAGGLASLTDATIYLGPGAKVDFKHTEVKDGDVLTCGGRHARIIHTPGHTSEHISLYVDEWFVLTGDTLFVGDVGRVDLALGEIDDMQLRENARSLYASIQKLLTLPEWTEIFPGHFAGSVCGKGIDGKMMSTIGRELGKNKPLKLSAEEFVSYVLSDMPAPPADFRTIKQKNAVHRG